MSSDHQDFHLPSTTDELHHQPSSSTAGNNLHSFTTLLHPQTPSPMKPTDVNAVETNSTPESRLAAALGHAILNIPPTSFQDAVAATTTNNPLLRTLSDADSSANHKTTTTPPKAPRNNPLRRALSDTITSDYEPTQKTRTKNPLRRALSDTTEYQQPQKTPRVSSSPQSSSGKQSPQSERLRKMEEMVREIEQRCWEIMREEEHVEDDTNPNPHPNSLQLQPQELEESVGVERLKNGDLKFELSCSCGKRFEMLLKHNGYCFYKLT